MVHCIYLGVSGYNFKKILYSFFLKIFFTFTNSVDPDKMQHYAAFHLGLHCLQNYSFRGFPKYQGLTFWFGIKMVSLYVSSIHLFVCIPSPASLRCGP